MIEFDADYQTDSKMAFRNCFRFCGNQSFRKRRFLFENDAAVFARAFVFNLPEWNLSNRAGHFAFDTEVFETCGMGNNCVARCGVSRECLYVGELAIISRIQSNSFILKATLANRFNRVGILVYAPKKS
jgi:hypothetical protein